MSLYDQTVRAAEMIGWFILVVLVLVGLSLALTEAELWMGRRRRGRP